MNTSIQAKTFRREMRWAEKLLWRHLRNRKMANCKFRRQYSVGPYVLDFFCYENKLAVEIDGRQHGEARAQAHDAERDVYLKKHGIRIKRIWNFQLRENLDGVLAGIRMTLEELREPPHPTHLPRERESVAKIQPSDKAGQ
ncbi:MAG: DUF559 domain-containing protein [Lentisphaerae bacterium]|nr:DUF559 domain-containing protein [Lentisphaerota bacterium]